MKTVIVTIESQKQDFPAGTAPAGISITLSGGVHAPIVIASPGPYAATFGDVPSGVYSATAQAVDVNGAALGASAASAEFTIDADTVSVDVPMSISISFQ